jgi:enoyl-[acyl-carrier protein] reductase I
MIMQGKKGLIMGLANRFSIAYGIAESLKRHGAEMLFTAQTEYFKNKISEITTEFGAHDVVLCDVSLDGEIEKAFDKIHQAIGPIDFVVHSIAFADKNELTGNYYNTSRSNFLTAMNISCYSFTETCKYAYQKLMPAGGSILSLTYYGSEKVVPNYNVMALAKAALETSVRYLANDLGENKIRVNAISAGPIKTLAASGVGEFTRILETDRARSPLKRNVTQKDIGDTAVFLLSDMADGITGEIVHVDCGCSTIGVRLQ